MKLELPQNSLFSILLRSQWWVSVLIAVGVFAIGEIVSNLGDFETGQARVFTSRIGSLMPTVEDLKASFWPIVRGTSLGAFLGILPGTGPSIAAFSSYMLEKPLVSGSSRFS